MITHKTHYLYAVQQQITNIPAVLSECAVSTWLTGLMSKHAHARMHTRWHFNQDILMTGNLKIMPYLAIKWCLKSTTQKTWSTESHYIVEKRPRLFPFPIGLLSLEAMSGQREVRNMAQLPVSQNVSVQWDDYQFVGIFLHCQRSLGTLCKKFIECIRNMALVNIILYIILI